MSPMDIVMALLIASIPIVFGYTAYRLYKGFKDGGENYQQAKSS